MNLTVKNQTTEGATRFVQALVDALAPLSCSVSILSEDPKKLDTVLEVNSGDNDIFVIQDIVEGVMEETGVKVWFWTYVSRKTLQPEKVV